MRGRNFFFFYQTKNTVLIHIYVILGKFRIERPQTISEASLGVKFVFKGYNSILNCFVDHFAPTRGGRWVSEKPSEPRLSRPE